MDGQLGRLRPVALWGCTSLHHTQSADTLSLLFADDHPTKRRQSEASELERLDAKRDPDDRDEKDQAPNGIGECKEQPGDEPEKIAHQTAGPNAVRSHRHPAEGPQAEPGELEALHRERDGDDRQAEQDAEDQPSDRGVPSDQNEPQDVADGLHWRRSYEPGSLCRGHAPSDLAVAASEGYCLRADIVVDQAELYGLIDRVANLGRELLEVRRVGESRRVQARN